MVSAGNKAKRLSSVNHTIKTIHHHHHHHHNHNHHKLLECASNVGQVDYPDFPSLNDSQIDPWKKELPYGKEIGVAIAAAISYCNKDVLENYLKELCKERVTILKQQKGNILFLAHFY